MWQQTKGTNKTEKRRLKGLSRVTSRATPAVTHSFMLYFAATLSLAAAPFQAGPFGPEAGVSDALPGKERHAASHSVRPCAASDCVPTVSGAG